VITSDTKEFVEFDRNNGSHLQVLLNDKKFFILGNWNLDNPLHKMTDYDELMKIINSSKDFQKWYAIITKRFGYLHELPSWVLLDPILREQWLVDSSTIFEEFKTKRKEIVFKKEKVMKTITDQLTALNDSEETLVNDFYNKYPIVAISKIPTQGLPGDTILAHASKPTEERERQYEIELDKYKKKLCDEYVNQGEEKQKELLELLKEVI
jgi:hypothetical protein